MDWCSSVVVQFRSTVKGEQMATYRCPKHDVVFDTETDDSKPGKTKKAADGVTDIHIHPIDCHPDCPTGKRERAAAQTGGALTRRIA